jgi:hypothetical protein
VHWWSIVSRLLRIGKVKVWMRQDEELLAVEILATMPTGVREFYYAA